VIGRATPLVLAAALYLLTRVVLFSLGVRFGADYLWQHFHDPVLLKTRLWESLVHTHAFTPFISMLAGLVLKVSDEHSLAIYQLIFVSLGFGFYYSITYLLRVFGLSTRAALGIATLFACTPAYIYFENFLHYEFLAAALLAISAVLFHHALVDGTWRRWFCFFLLCALVSYVRTTFHLVWLVGLVVLAVLFQHKNFRTVISAATIPLLLVIALYAKNLHMFGFFGTSSWFGFNLAIVTTQRLTKTERRDWIAQHKLHPVSAVGLYRGIEAYRDYVNVEGKTGIPVLDQLERSNGQPNYNHHAFIEVSKLRMAGNRIYLAERRSDYIRTILSGYVDYFRPSTRWHPHDEKSSPHLANRRVIGTWENLYNRVLHRVPVRPFGLYLLIVPAMLWSLFSSTRALYRSRLAGGTREKLVLFLTFNALYVPVLSCLVTIGELERYRFMVEGFMWIVCIGCVLMPLTQRLRRLLGATSAHAS
jgi:hypothetical protein